MKNEKYELFKKCVLIRGRCNTYIVTVEISFIFKNYLNCSFVCQNYNLKF